MEIAIKKSVLFNFLKKSLQEDARGDMFLTPSKFMTPIDIEEESPIEASPYMATQLAEQEPPVEDPEYVPASIEELCLASCVIMREVPRNQVEFVYRFLHKILDMALDKQDDEEENFLLEALTPDQIDVIKAALPRIMQGEPIDAISRELADRLDAEELEIEEALGDAMMGSLDQTPEPAAEKKPVSTVSTQVSQNVRRRRAAPVRKKAEEPLEDVPSETRGEDLTGEASSAYEAASNKEQFMSGYNQGADDGMSDKSAVDLEGSDEDFVSGYNAGYKDFIEPLSGIKPTPEVEMSRREKMAQERDMAAGQRDALLRQYSEKIGMSYENMPKIFGMMQEFDGIVTAMYLEVDTTGIALIGQTGNEERGWKTAAKLYNIPHTHTLHPENVKKGYFNKDFAMKSAGMHLDVILDGTVKSRDARIFSQGFNKAIEADTENLGETKEELTRSFLEAYADQLMFGKKNRAYLRNPDQESRLRYLLQTNFAELTVYKTGTAAGPGGSEREKSKEYQQNTSATFLRRVTEEQRPVILSEFLDKLTDKYLVGDTFRIPSGKGREYYDIDPETLREEAETYANSIIDMGIESQNSISQLTDGEEIDISWAPESTESPEAMEAKTEKEASGFFKKYANEFGFKGASGFRQDYLKYDERMLKILVISLRSENQEFINYHRRTIRQVLNILSNSMAGVYSDKINDPDAGVLPHIAAAAHEEIQMANSTMKSDRDLTLTDVEVTPDDGPSLPFVKTPGGILVRSIVGDFFRAFLRGFDKEYTNFVKDKLMNDPSVVTHISEMIQDNPSINPMSDSAAQSLAEYWTGKKNIPKLVVTKKTDEYNDEYEVPAFAPQGDGTYTKGVNNLMAAGIDGELFHYIYQMSKRYFELTATKSFAVENDEEIVKDYREKINKLVEKFESNTGFLENLVNQNIQKLYAEYGTPEDSEPS